MKRFLRHIALFATLLCGTVACETVVEFRGEYTDPMAVLYSVVTPGEPIVAYYSRSVFMLDEGNPTYIRDGVVELYINDEFVEQLQMEEQVSEYDEITILYRGTATAAVADKVTLRARCEEFPEWVSGTTVVPFDALVSDFVVTPNEINEEGRLAGGASVRLTDPDGATNYYLVEGWTLIYRDPERPIYNYTIPFEYSDVAFSSGRSSDVILELINDAPDYVVFDDTLIDGQKEYLLTMEWEFGEYYLHNYPLSFNVNCLQIDEHLYKYMRSVELSDNVQLFGEPVQIYTNVVGGVGLVGSRSRAVSMSIGADQLFDVDYDQEEEYW